MGNICITHTKTGKTENKCHLTNKIRRGNEIITAQNNQFLSKISMAVFVIVTVFVPYSNNSAQDFKLYIVLTRN